MAADRAGGPADPVVAAACHAAGAAAGPVSGDPAPVRAAADRGDAAPHPVVAVAAAPGAGGAGDPGPGPPAVEPRRTAAGQRPAPAGRRRRLGGGETLGVAAAGDGRPHRSGRARRQAGHGLDHGGAGDRRAPGGEQAPAPGRRPRPHPGHCAKAVARRPGGGAVGAGVPVIQGIGEWRLAIERPRRRTGRGRAPGRGLGRTADEFRLLAAARRGRRRFGLSAAAARDRERRPHPDGAARGRRRRVDGDGERPGRGRATPGPARAAIRRRGDGGAAGPRPAPGAAQPPGQAGAGGRGHRRRRGPPGRAFPAPAGGTRLRRDGGAGATPARRPVLPRAGAEPVRGGAQGEPVRNDGAALGGARPRRHRHPHRRRGVRARGMDGARRSPGAILRPAPSGGRRPAAAGGDPSRRPRLRRRHDLVAASAAVAVRVREPVRRIADHGRGHGAPAGPSGAGTRPGPQGLGPAQRRHAAGHRRSPRQRMAGARPHHRQQFVVGSGALRPVRGDAAANRRLEPGRGRGRRQRALAAAGRTRRLRSPRRAAGERDSNTRRSVRRGSAGPEIATGLLWRRECAPCPQPERYHRPTPAAGRTAPGSCARGL